MKKHQLLPVILLMVVLPIKAFSTIRHVPATYSTIQAGINASVNGDTVLVDPGTYYENLNLNGKNIKLCSKYLTTGDTAYITNTKIDGSNTASVIKIINGENASCQVTGFTIQYGNGTGNPNYGSGGGIFCMNASPVIQYCYIRNNQAPGVSAGGGGVYMGDSNGLLRFCRIEQNVAGNGGGGLFFQANSQQAVAENCIIAYNTNLTTNTFNAGGGGVGLYHSGKLENCLIIHNSVPNAPVGGGGVYCDVSSNSIFITGCTIAHNTALNWGGTNHVGTDGQYRNCIIWGNTDNNGNTSNSNGTSLTYCCTTPLPSGTGNISSDPDFINATTHNFRLTAGSPCINAGNNSYSTQPFDLDGNTRINGGTIDMGCYEASSVPLQFSVTSHVPAKNANSINPSANVTITFSESLDQSTLTNANIRIFGSQSGLHPAVITYDDPTKTVTLNPNSDFRLGEVMEVVVTKQVKSQGGSSLLQPYTWTFFVKVNSSSDEFALSQSIPSPGNALGSIFSDLDNDGDLDVIVTHHDAANADIFRNDGAGIFTKVATLSGNGMTWATYPPVSGDFDNDGDMDIAIPARYANKVSIWRNNGGLSFSAWQQISVHTEPMQISVSDLNGDGSLDMIVNCNNASTHYYDVLMNDKSGNFSVSQGVGVPKRQAWQCLGDFDGDGDVDFIGGAQSETTLYFMKNNGSGSFTVSTFPLNSACASSGDFDNDGDLDLIVSTPDIKYLQVLINNGTGSFTAGSTFGPQREYYTKLINDFNNDGTMDFAVLCRYHGIDIYLNNGAGTFTLDYSFSPDLGDAMYFDTGDIDSDGDLDMIVPFANSDIVSVYKAGSPGINWLGVTEDWSTPSNWSSGTIPTATDNLIIPANPSGGHMPLISTATTAECNNMTINSNALLTINAEKSLNSYGTLNSLGNLDCFGIITVGPAGILNTHNHVTIFNNGSLMHGQGTPGGGGTVNGNVIVKRSGNTGDVQNFWSSPLSNGNTISFNTNQVWWFNPDNAHASSGFQDGWVHCPQSPMTVTRGYTVIGGGDVTLSGTVNNGTYDFYVKDLGASGNDGCNLIGNPYPSAISADDFLNNTYNMTAMGEVAVFLWTDDHSGGTGYTNGPADFTTINLLGIIDPTGGGNPHPNPEKIIGSCQGFEVLADGNPASQLQMQFTNSMRRGNNDVFYKSTEETFPSIKLSVKLNDSVYNELIVGFKEDATDGFDKKYDASKMSGNNYIAFYSKINGKRYCIQGLPPVMNSNKEVKIGLYAQVTGNYTLKVVYAKNFNSGIEILLEDKVTGIWTKLSGDVQYNFNISDPGVYDDRFVLHFITVGIQDKIIEPITIFSSDGNIIVENPENIKGKIDVFDAIGKKLHSHSLDPGQSVLGFDHVTGCYIVRILTEKSNLTKKIFLPY